MKTGEDKDDTFLKILQQVVRITLPIAYGIASRYPSVVKLVEAFRKHGPLVLEDLKVSLDGLLCLCFWCERVCGLKGSRNVRIRMERCRIRGSGRRLVRGCIGFLWRWIRG